MVPKLLDSICHRFPNLLKNVIIGSGFSNIDKIKRIVDNNTRLFYSPEPNSLINIIVSSDIAISAAGQTLFELARCGIPIIAVAVANNQKTNISQFKKLGLTLSSNNCLNNKIMENIIDDMVILSDQKIRKRVSDRAMKLIDGKGSGRIVDYLVNGKVNKAV